MRAITDIHWLVGFLEGEGCFTQIGGSPSIQVQTTDKDVVDRAGRILSAKVRKVRPTVTGTPVWMIAFYGPKAIAWMMTLYDLMGERRRKRIAYIVDYWKTRPFRGARFRKRDANGRLLPWNS